MLNKKVAKLVRENLDIIFYQSNESIVKSFELMDAIGKQAQDEVAEAYGAPYEDIKAYALQVAASFKP